LKEISRVELLELLKNEILDFFSIQGLIDLIRSGDYSSLKTWSGITTALAPLVPLIVVVEMAMALLHQKLRFREYKLTLLIYVFNRIVGRFISLGVVAFCIGIFQPLGVIHIGFTWYWLIYAYLVWEFAHFIYHFLAHKVRLFWCLHSTHHAQESMNIAVTYNHFILEAPYADFIRTSICIVLGVDPAMLFMIMFIDGTWGGFIHVGENFMKDARFGFLQHLILTPSHHRVHHARNPLYMDTNFCNLLNVWDRVFRTYQPEDRQLPIEYGITRQINPGNFVDVYFGEIYYLIKDVVAAPGLKNKLLYVLMPPGWNHRGNHKTANVIRNEYLNQSRR
jgi:sterol desaturase/sphingolipid hydroxylase (fatty acid hydroxylase superfamily)